jgi:hypothetical protein
MSFKTTSLLFGLLIGMLWVFGITLSLKKGSADEGFVLPSLHDEQGIAFDSFEINRGGKKYQFVHTEKGWKLRLPPHKEELRVEEFKVDRILEQIKGARKNDEADVTRDLAKFGLTNPSAVVTLKKKGGGKEWTFNVGGESPDKAFVYVNSSDRPRDVLAVRTSALDALLFKSANELRARGLLDVTDLNAQSVDLKEPKGKDNKAVEVALEKTDQGAWRFKQPAYGAADFEGAPGKTDPGGVKGLLTAIGAVRVEADDDFEPLGERSMKDFGLEEGGPKVRIQVERSAGFGADKAPVKEALLIGDKVKDKDQYYARLESDQAVVRVGAKKLEPIFKVLSDPKALRSYDLAQVEPTSPDAIDIARGKGLTEVVKLRRPELTLWKLYAKGDVPRKADTTAIEGDKGLVATLQGKRQIKEFFDAASDEETKKLDAKLGLDNPTAEVKVWMGAVEHEEKKDVKKGEAKDKDKAGKKDQEKEAEAEPRLKKDAKPAVTLTFGKKDKGLVYVKRVAADGTVSRLAVPISILEKVDPPEGALAFLDHSLPGFSVLDVSKLEVVRGKDRFEVERAKEAKDAKDAKQPPWLLMEPKDLPNRTAADTTAVDQVLDALAMLNVKKWVKRVDLKDQKELAKFGLDAPAVAVTVTVKKPNENKKLGEDKKPTEDKKAAQDKKPGEDKKAAQDKGQAHVYKFGKETEVAGDKPGIYGIQGNSDLVFLVNPEVVKTLRDAELRDRTVFKFEPDKVKEIKVAIRKAGEGLRIPVFERKGDIKAWVIKSGLEDFGLDENKVDELVQTLSNLKAEKFVSFKGPPQADYKLGEKEAALRIEVVLEDGKTKHELTVGAAKEKTGYYAQSDTLPGVVFLVPYDRFTPILGGVSYFSKNRAAE